MADFQAAIEYVLANEGALVNDPADPGGLTNFGISQSAYPDLDIRALTRDAAIAIYQRDYWKFGDVQNQRVATKLFDAYVNMEHAAIRLVQLSLDYLQAGPVVADGNYGPQTVEHINAAGEVELIDEFKARLGKFYHDDVAAHPERESELLGWLRRAVKG
jgi:lysozyme family protein